MKRLLVLGLVLVLAVAAFAPSALAAKYTLHFNHVLGPNHPYHKALETWAQRVRNAPTASLRFWCFTALS